MQRTDYRFTLTRDTDTFEVFPEGFFQGSFKDLKEEGQAFFRREYTGELAFRGDDYIYIKGRYDLSNYCDVYELLIERKVSGVYEVFWTGFFSMTDGKFDFEKCRYYVKPSTEDKYSCILNNWGNEYNILSIGGIDITGKVVSILEFESYTRRTGCSAPASTPYNAQMAFFYCHDSAVITDAYFYAREAIILDKDITPTGVGWVEETDFTNPNMSPNITPNETQKKWVRPWTYAVSITEPNGVVLVYDEVNDDCSITIRTPNDLGYTGEWYAFHKAYRRNLRNCKGDSEVYWIKKTDYAGLLFSGNESVYSGVYLIDVIKFLYESSCQAIDLDARFLTSAINPVTTLSSKTNNLCLVQKSDAKRPNASNAATKGITSFREVMEMLYNVFQLYWFISDDNRLTIVHQTELSNLPGLNISVAPYIQFTAHKKAIDFDKTLLYRYEKWSFMESNGDDFNGLPIEYSEFCSYKSKDSKTKQYDSENFTTDLGYIQTSSDKISDDGFVLLATDGTDVLIEEGLITESDQLNGHLSIANLQYNYWRHNRILSTGLMNGVQTTFLSTQKIRKLPEIQIQYCGDFDPINYITTELGQSQVNEAEFFPMDNKISLSLSI